MSLRRELVYYVIAGGIGGMALGVYAWALGCAMSLGLCASFWSDTKVFFPASWPFVCAVASGLSSLVCSGRFWVQRPVLRGISIATLTFFLYVSFHGLVVFGAGLPGIHLALLVGGLYGGIPIIALGALSGWGLSKLTSELSRISRTG